MTVGTKSSDYPNYTVVKDPYAFVYRDGVWSAAPSLRSGQEWISGLSCPEDGFCVAIGRDTNATYGSVYVYAGGTWSDPVRLAGLNTDAAVSCVSSSFCLAVGGNFKTSESYAYSFDGTTWTQSQHFAQGSVLSSVSCPTVSFCLAVGSANGPSWSSSFRYSGGSWSPVPTDTINAMRSVSCTADSWCMATSYAETYLYSNGRWITSGVSLLDSFSTSVSCPITSFCVLIGGGEARVYG